MHCDHSLKLIHFFDKFFIFAPSLDTIQSFLLEIKPFFSSKSLFFKSYLFKNSFTFSRNRHLEKEFFVSPYKSVFFSLANEVRFFYLQKLKNIVKASLGLSIISLIISLNKEINNWLVSYSYYFDISQKKELDLYVYKLLWKFFKKCHPRRSNTWIYSKYWKIVFGVPKVFAFDGTTGKFYFLKSHSKVNLNNYCLPLFLHPFNKMSYKKLFSVLFKKSRGYFYGACKFLFIKQKGLCFSCNKPLIVSAYKMEKLAKGFVKQPNSFVLLHTYC